MLSLGVRLTQVEIHFVRVGSLFWIGKEIYNVACLYSLGLCLFLHFPSLQDNQIERN